MRVMQEWTLEGRLFQIAGAVERKRRAPNEMLQRVTEKVGRGRRYSSAWSVPLDQMVSLMVSSRTLEARDILYTYCGDTVGL